MERTNKTQQVLRHLQTKGTITSMEAFELYGATRLSAIIFNLRHKYLIESVDMEITDRYGNTCHFAKYVYRRELHDGEYLEMMKETD